MLDQTQKTAATEDQVLVGEAFLASLKANGVDYLFANAGTDFPPIIEAIAQSHARRTKIPEALVIPHETVAVGMAHGYYLATGKAQAVMVHVNVGLANTAMGVLNAASDEAAMLVCSGRTPLTEGNREGARSSPIHWGQEMYDQNALVREPAKWHYELRYPEQVAQVVGRALSIARSEPAGPAYLSLPREVLSERCPAAGMAAKPAPAIRPVLPLDSALAEAAQMIGAAEHPVIITHGLAGAAEVEALEAMAAMAGIPVVEYFPTKVAIRDDHPAAAGQDPQPFLKKADLIIVLQALVPWVPDIHATAPGARIVSIGTDPLYQKLPVRGFTADLALAGSIAATLHALAARIQVPATLRSRRLDGIAALRGAQRAAIAKRVEVARVDPMGPAWVTHCIDQALPDDAIIVNELGVDSAILRFRAPASYFATPLSGGLGFGMPAALGAQLADRGRQVVACVGDGSYMFANPVACHQVAQALELPLLTIVMNNGLWNAVRRSTLHMYPDGASAKGRMPLTEIGAGTNYAMIAEAHGAFALRVTDPEELPGALRAALAETAKGRQALLELRVGV